jgi:hypothetical protein
MKAESIAEELKQVQFYIYVIVAFIAQSPHISFDLFKFCKDFILGYPYLSWL